MPYRALRTLGRGDSPFRDAHRAAAPSKTIVTPGALKASAIGTAMALHHGAAPASAYDGESDVA